MKKEKEFLRQRLIEFQKKAVDLDHAMKETRRECETREKRLFQDIMGVLDAMDILDANLAEKEAGFDKTTRMLAKNVRSIHKKLNRVLRSRQITPIPFQDNHATMETCIISETRPDPEKENETIVSVIKKGYMHKASNQVLRKAEVITVLNEE